MEINDYSPHSSSQALKRQAAASAAWDQSKR
jgi:hypothetical protein